MHWKNISMWAKVSQVSDVAHGPLVTCVYFGKNVFFPEPEGQFQSNFAQIILR
jgi:hypothetical protein